MVIYPDGVTEARNDRDDFYTLERLVRVVTEHGAQSVEDLIGLVRNDVHGFISNQPQFADLTLVIMEVR